MTRNRRMGAPRCWWRSPASAPEVALAGRVAHICTTNFRQIGAAKQRGEDRRRLSDKASLDERTKPLARRGGHSHVSDDCCGSRRQRAEAQLRAIRTNEGHGQLLAASDAGADAARTERGVGSAPRSEGS